MISNRIVATSIIVAFSLAATLFGLLTGTITWLIAGTNLALVAICFHMATTREVK